MMKNMQGSGRFTPAIKWALGGFVAAAAISLMIPATILESFISAIGLPEMIAASAPPLGVKARLIIALFCGMVAAAIIYVLAPHKDNDAENGDFESYEDASADTESATKSTIMDRLRGFRPGSGKDDSGIRDLSDLPKIRSADAHPDAPARRPLFAGEDLADHSPLSVKPFTDEAEGEPAAAPMPSPAASLSEEREPEYEIGEDMEYDEFVPHVSAENEPETEIIAEPEAAAEPVAEEPMAARQHEPGPAEPDQAGLSDLPINELVNRLEQSLAALKNGAAVHAAEKAAEEMAEPAPAVKAAPEPIAGHAVEPEPALSQPGIEAQTAQNADDMDEALKAALATLQRMTSK